MEAVVLVEERALERESRVILRAGLGGLVGLRMGKGVSRDDGGNVILGREGVKGGGWAYGWVLLEASESLLGLSVLSRYAMNGIGVK